MMEKACRTCLKLVRLESVPYFEVEDADVQLSPNSNRYKILSVFPEMALNISKKSVICSSCHQTVEMIYQFKLKCLRTESMIMRYIHSKPDLEIETIDLKEVALVNNTGYVTGKNSNAETNSSHLRMNLEQRKSSHVNSKENYLKRVSSSSSRDSKINDSSVTRNPKQIENAKNEDFSKFIDSSVTRNPRQIDNAKNEDFNKFNDSSVSRNPRQIENAKNEDINKFNDSSVSRYPRQIENAKNEDFNENQRINGCIGDGVVIKRVRKVGNKKVEEISSGVTIEKVGTSQNVKNNTNTNCNQSTNLNEGNKITDQEKHLSQEVSSNESLDTDQIIVKQEIFTEEDEYNEDSFYNSSAEIDESITVVKHELINDVEHEMVIPPENTIRNVTLKKVDFDDENGKGFEIRKNSIQDTLKTVGFNKHDMINDVQHEMEVPSEHIIRDVTFKTDDFNEKNSNNEDTLKTVGFNNKNGNSFEIGKKSIQDTLKTVGFNKHELMNDIEHEMMIQPEHTIHNVTFKMDNFNEENRNSQDTLKTVGFNDKNGNSFEIGIKSIQDTAKPVGYNYKSRESFEIRKKTIPNTLKIFNDEIGNSFEVGKKSIQDNNCKIRSGNNFDDDEVMNENEIQVDTFQNSVQETKKVKKENNFKVTVEQSIIEKNSNRPVVKYDLRKRVSKETVEKLNKRLEKRNVVEKVKLLKSTHNRNYEGLKRKSALEIESSNDDDDDFFNDETFLEENEHSSDLNDDDFFNDETFVEENEHSNDSNENDCDYSIIPSASNKANTIRLKCGRALVNQKGNDVDAIRLKCGRALVNQKSNNVDAIRLKCGRTLLNQKGNDVNQDAFSLKNCGTRTNSEHSSAKLMALALKPRRSDSEMYEIHNKTEHSEISFILVKKKRMGEQSETGDLSIIPVSKKICNETKNVEEGVTKIKFEQLRNDCQGISEKGDFFGEQSLKQTENRVNCPVRRTRRLINKFDKANEEININGEAKKLVMNKRVNRKSAERTVVEVSDNSVDQVKVESVEMITDDSIIDIQIPSEINHKVNTTARTMIKKDISEEYTADMNASIKDKFGKDASVDDIVVESNEISALQKIDLESISYKEVVTDKTGRVLDKAVRFPLENIVHNQMNSDLKPLHLHTEVMVDEFKVTSMELGTASNNDELKIDAESSKLDDSGVQSGGSEDSPKDDQQYFKCTVCSKLFVTRSRLKTHMLCHTDERPYKCTFCVKGFNDKSTLKKHLKIHSGVKDYECEICQRQFYCKGNLNKHMSTHSGERPYKCPICNRDFSRNEHLKQHKLIHTGDKNFECDICQKKFARRDSLIIHMMVHTGVRNYTCDYCDKRCIDSSTLKKHLRSHTGDKPYECDVCQRRFTQKTHLTIHRRKHTGERPYNCNVCSKSFYSSNYLKIHKRTHTKERPYQCDVCKKKFSTVSNLRMHTKIHTGVRDFECGICNKMFIHKHDLRKHMMVHTQEKPFSCHVCGKAFNKKTRARQHIVNMHKEVDVSLVVIERDNTYVQTELKVEEVVEHVEEKD